MLQPAIQYREQLDAITYGNIWFNEKYKYWNSSQYYAPIPIDGDTWNRHQFVSVYNGEVIGYIAYNIARSDNVAHSLSIINFSDNHMVFARDLARVVKDIFEKFNFRKLNFFVVVGNPIEESYDRFVERYGGRIVGTFVDDVKLYDGKYYNRKAYEILSENYYASRFDSVANAIKRNCQEIKNKSDDAYETPDETKFRAMNTPRLLSILPEPGEPNYDIIIEILRERNALYG